MAVEWTGYLMLGELFIYLYRNDLWMDSGRMDVGTDWINYNDQFGDYYWF